MITNEQYLIQKFAEAREKIQNYTLEDAGRLYWKGVMDTYHSLLNESFSGWAEHGSTGYFVFYEEMTYDAALNAASKERESFERDRSNYHTERDPEERYWDNVATWNERHSHGDVDDDFDY